jgi:hypothetical protein
MNFKFTSIDLSFLTVICVSAAKPASMQKTLRRILAITFTMTFALGFTTFIALPIAPAHAVVNTFQTCDIFTGVGGGQINWYRPDTCPGVPASVTFQGTLQAVGSWVSGDTYMTGMTFDVNGGCLTIGQPCLYATTFNANTIAVFDVSGASLGTCGAAGAADPVGNSDIESANAVPGFSTGPSIFFGQADGDHKVLQYPLPCNSASPLTNSFTAATQSRGTDWVDMTKNLCDLHTTSEGTLILDFNVCTNTQGPNFATLPGSNVYAHKSLGDGGAIAADTQYAVHVDNTGTVVNTCASTGASTYFSMDILPDQKSFAVANLGGDNTVHYITVAHCDAGQAASDFVFTGLQSGQSGCGGCIIGGVAIFGEFTPQPTLSTKLSATTITSGNAVTDTATLANLNSPTGTITFFVGTSRVCPNEGATQVGSPVTVTGNGDYLSASKTFGTAGTYFWYAHYSGDSNNKALNSACEPLVVTGTATAPEFGAPALMIAAVGLLAVALLTRKLRPSLSIKTI